MVGAFGAVCKLPGARAAMIGTALASIVMNGSDGSEGDHGDHDDHDDHDHKAITR